MRTLPLCLAGLLCFVLAACGGQSSEGGGRAAPSGDPVTKTSSYTVVTPEGKKTLAYALALPPSYECTSPDEVLQRWQVPGVSGREAPRVRVGPAKQPASMEVALTRAKKGVTGPREIVFQKETDTVMVVIARDAHGTWTEITGWVKGEGLRPHCTIELHAVEADGAQVAWAKAVALSLKSRD